MELACDAGSVRILSGSFPAEGGLDPSTALWLTDYDPAQWAEIAVSATLKVNTSLSNI